MNMCNPVNAPMECGVKLSRYKEGEKMDPTQYKSLVGSLPSLTCIRSDIPFVVGIISRHMEAHKQNCHDSPSPGPKNASCSNVIQEKAMFGTIQLQITFLFHHILVLLSLVFAG